MTNEIKIAVGVHTYNVLSTMRVGLLEDTMASLRLAFPDCPLVLLDNGSDDGSGELIVQEMDGVSCVSKDGNHTPGRGRNLLMPLLMEFDPDVCVFSDDDMTWKLGAQESLQRFWRSAPNDLLIVSGLLEPEWHWNTPRFTVDSGGERVLVRDSCPGAAWSFRSTDWSVIGPVVDDFGYDYKTCVRLRKEGYHVAQIDLATHEGWGYSTHGNEANEHQDTKPLDRKKWGI